MIVDVAGAAVALQAADDILILTHRRPDGDTAGCAGALCRGLQQIGKRVYILENPEITRRYAPLIVPYYPPEDFVPAYVVSTDIAEEKLFPDTAETRAIQKGISRHQRVLNLFSYTSSFRVYAAPGGA